MRKVALFSGGKDSLYAALREWPVDAFLILHYDFPYPSPHLVNLGATILTGILTGVPVMVAKLRKGLEPTETVEVLRKLNAGIVIAGDVYIEDHLRYMERVASEAGAELREPLWGEDPLELLHREVKAGIDTLVTGVINGLEELLGVKLNAESLEQFVGKLMERGIDPLGENGEYHTLVLNSPVHTSRLRVRVAGEVTSGRGRILKVIPESIT